MKTTRIGEQSVFTSCKRTISLIRRYFTISKRVSEGMVSKEGIVAIVVSSSITILFMSAQHRGIVCTSGILWSTLTHEETMLSALCHVASTVVKVEAVATGTGNR